VEEGPVGLTCEPCFVCGRPLIPGPSPLECLWRREADADRAYRSSGDWITGKKLAEVGRHRLLMVPRRYYDLAMENQVTLSDSLNSALTLSVSDVLTDLGGIPAERLLAGASPTVPAQADLSDLAKAHASGRLCELVDGVLVEKSMGYRKSLLAAILIEFLSRFARSQKLGLVSGPDGFAQLFPSLVRGPDVAFISWERLPGRKPPTDAYPTIVPEIVIEIISAGNTRAEMARKRREYFQAGVRLVWMVDPLRRSVAVFTSVTESTVLQDDQSLEGGDVLPGLAIPLPEVFAVLAAGPEQQPGA